MFSKVEEEEEEDEEEEESSLLDDPPVLFLVSGLVFSTTSSSLFRVPALLPQGLPPLSMMRMQLLAGRRGTVVTNRTKTYFASFHWIDAF